MKTILTVTSGRADGCPLRPVIAAMDAHPELKAIELRVGGWRAGEVTSVVQDDQHKVDLVLLLGDRYESLAAALGATLALKPIAHIHGGEASYGSFDHQIRDALTKLAHLHFVAAKAYANRLVRFLGEPEERVHLVGAPGLDNLVDVPPRHPGKTFLCTYHPVTATEESIEPLLEALDSFKGYQQIWTGVNNDPGRDAIRRILADRPTADFTLRKYLRACREAALVVGNSSSGIIEAPSLEVPSVDVGFRQAGRLRGPSVFTAPMQVERIRSAIEQALRYTGSFNNPYHGPGASQRIVDILAETDFSGLRMKRLLE